MIENLLTALAVSVVPAMLVVYIARVVLARVDRWPGQINWFWRFAAPLSVLIFMIVALNNLVLKQVLDDNNLRPWTKIVIVISAFFFLLSVIRAGKLYLQNVFDIATADNLGNRMRQTQLQFIEKLLVLTLFVICGGSALLSFDAFKEVGTSVLASAGLVAIVIGTASQKIVGNLLAGFQIAFSQPIRLDDAVVIDGEWGWIEEITLTYVVVRLWDWRRLIVPLSRLLEQSFQNWTRQQSKLIGTVFLYVSYTVNLDEIREELDRVLAATPLWDGDVKSVQVTDSKPQTMEVRILASARNSSQAFDLRCIIREKIVDFLIKKSPSLVGEVRMHMETQPRV